MRSKSPAPWYIQNHCRENKQSPRSGGKHDIRETHGHCSRLLTGCERCDDQPTPDPACCFDCPADPAPAEQ